MQPFTQQELGPVLHTETGRTSLPAEKRKPLLALWDARDAQLMSTLDEMTQSPDAVLQLSWDAVDQIFETLRHMDQETPGQSAEAA